MISKANKIRNIKPVKALRGDPLSIDLGVTYTGTMTAWMKKSPNDSTYRLFTIIDGRYLTMTGAETSDFYSGETLVEAVEGKWYFDVEFLSNVVDAVAKTIYTGSIIFYNDVTNSTGVQSSPFDDVLETPYQISIQQTDHGFVVGDGIKFDGLNYIKALGDVEANAGIIGIVSSIEDEHNFTYQFGGLFTATSWTDGESYFLSTDTAGAVVTEPTYVTGEYRQFVGTAIAEGLLINIDFGEVFNAEAGAVDQIVAGLGISVDQSTGTVTVTNTNVVSDAAFGIGWDGDLESATKNSLYDIISTLGTGNVSSIIAGTNISIDQATGNVTINNDLNISDDVYGIGWNGDLDGATKNAIYDIVSTLVSSIVAGTGISIDQSTGTVTITNDNIISDIVYGVSWNGNLDGATKNAIYDEMETIKASIVSIDNTAYGATWDANLDGATKNVIYDEIESVKATIPTIDDTAFGISWDSNFDGPTKNAIYDYLISLNTGVSSIIAGAGISIDSSTGDVTITSTGIGVGDMLKATYDPTLVGGDAFDMDNMVEGIVNLILTVSERAILDNTSGVNTGDQDLGIYALKSNVLELDQTDAFTPTANYQPATKLYVDSKSIGASSIIAGTGISVNQATGAVTVTNTLNISDTPYGVSWNGNLVDGASKNAIYDEIETIKGTIKPINDNVYDVSWNGSLAGASQNSIYDKIELLNSSITPISNLVYGIGWDANLEGASKNAIYDKIESLTTTIIPISNTAYSALWNTNTDGATKNAIYDEIEAVKLTIKPIDNTVYGISWDGNFDGATKNALYDKLESISAGGVTSIIAGTDISINQSTGAVTITNDLSIDNDAYGIAWSGDLSGTSKDSLYNKFEAISASGVSSIIAGANISVDSATGAVTISGDASTDTSEWATYLGTRAGFDLDLTIGDFDNSGNGTSIQIDDAISRVIVNGDTTVNGNLQINNDDLIFNDSTWNAIIRNGAQTNSVTLTLPTATGTFALTSDIASPSDSIYGALWDGNLEAATKNALYDKMQTFITSRNLQQVLADGSTAVSPDTDTTVEINVGNSSKLSFRRFDNATNIDYGITTDNIQSKLFYRTDESLASVVAVGGEISLESTNTTNGSTTKLNVQTASTDGFAFQVNVPRPTLVSNKTVNMPVSVNGTEADANGNITIATTVGVNSIIAGTGISIDSATGDVTITNTESATAEWSTFTGTRAGSNLVLTVGDFDASGNRTTVKVDDLNEIVTIEANRLYLGDAEASAFHGIFVLDTFSADRTYTFPNASGQIALTSDITPVSDLVYGVGWDGNLEAATKNAIYDKIETLVGGAGDVTKVGTPVNNQLGVWTGDGTLEGESFLTYSPTLFSLNVAGNNHGMFTVTNVGVGVIQSSISLDIKSDALSIESGAGNVVISSDGVNATIFEKLFLGDYGSGVQTGTALYSLAVNSAGDVIEEALSSLQSVTDVGFRTTNSIEIGTGNTLTAGQGVLTVGTGIQAAHDYSIYLAGSANAVTDNTTNLFGGANFIISDVYFSGTASIRNNAYANISAGFGNTIGGTDVGISSGDAVVYASLQVGIENELWASKGSGQIGTGLKSGASRCLTVGSQNRDITQSKATPVHWDSIEYNPRFVVGTSTDYNETTQVGVARNGFVVMQDGHVSAPELTIAKIDSPRVPIVDSGTTDSTLANSLVDSTQNFLSTIQVGDVVRNTTDVTVANVTAVVSDTTLTLDADIMVTAEAYEIDYGNFEDRTLTTREWVRAQGLVGYTVATLPGSPSAGDQAYVTDATTPTYLGTLTGGGAVVCKVFYNGTAWIS